ncbi:hypothetical protein [Coxiella burnetii]|uniref:hypothetical protein n=2 Tax=Coxiella burnetii TaxID=777 RepID=UPI001E2835A2|nr:hypothetical protein [Coxiella burnetii]
MFLSINKEVISTMPNPKKKQKPNTIYKDPNYKHKFFALWYPEPNRKQWTEVPKNTPVFFTLQSWRAHKNRKTERRFFYYIKNPTENDDSKYEVRSTAHFKSTTQGSPPLNLNDSDGLLKLVRPYGPLYFKNGAQVRLETNIYELKTYTRGPLPSHKYFCKDKNDNVTLLTREPPTSPREPTFQPISAFFQTFFYNKEWQSSRDKALMEETKEKSCETTTAHLPLKDIVQPSLFVGSKTEIQITIDNDDDGAKKDDSPIFRNNGANMSFLKWFNQTNESNDDDAFGSTATL